MLKKKMAAMCIPLMFAILFTPAISYAVPIAGTGAPERAALGTLAKLVQLWNWLHPAAERPAPALQKNGCGIDPQGQPACGTGNGPGGGLAAGGEPPAVEGPGK